MMKLVNRLLIIAVIAFGAWFIIQHWDSVETPVEDQGEVVFEVTEGEGELVLDIDSDLTLEEQLAALRQQRETVAPALLSATTTVTTEKKEATPVAMGESKVKVYLFEGGVDLSVSTIPAGHVTFTVRNDGRVSHDFSVEGVEDFGRITPGSEHTFELNLSAGEYVLSSPRELDQRLDMRETLYVENAE